MANHVLSIDRLKQGFYGVSPVVGMAHAEACLVCLEHHQHLPPITLSIDGTRQTDLQLEWHDTISEQAERSWYDLAIATEWAACGISFLIMEEFFGYTVVRKARKGNGFDYWLGEYDTKTQLVKEKARLEVSGILSASNNNTVKARVKQKINQVDFDKVETYIVIIEFSQPLAWMEQIG